MSGGIMQVMSSHEMLNRKVYVPGDGLKAETAPTSNDNLTVKRAIIGLTTEEKASRLQL
jgi:hypothetical protein